MNDNQLVVRAIPSSFVASNMKTIHDAGSGEAKLFVGSKANEAQYDAFFSFGSNVCYSFDKDNLVQYLLQVRMEYAYQLFNQYRNATLAVWEENLKTILEMNESDFVVQLEKFVDKSRYYIRARETVFSKTFRNLALPRLTNVVFSKDDTTSNISICLELNLDATTHQEAEETNDDITLQFYSELPRNRIVFGAPGTGKSHTLNNIDKPALLLGYEKNYERVTFHPDYSYAHFVGTYKPVPYVDKDGNDVITYKYVPGPFMRTLVKALSNSSEPYLLIIEEINRANVAAVFGDVFQLLDRDDSGISEYPIQASEDIKQHLAEKLHLNLEECSEIRIPSNMFIWATMNSADQGVFPMDTAFKRRWDFTYIGINDNEEEMSNKTVILGTGEYKRKVEWNALRKAINNELLKYKINEDKLMGPYFISKKNLGESDEIDPTEFIRVFKNKVLMYLFDDAAKQKRPTLFEGCEEKNLYSAICSEFDRKGVAIFCEAIRNQFVDVPEES